MSRVGPPSALLAHTAPHAHIPAAAAAAAVVVVAAAAAAAAEAAGLQLELLAHRSRKMHTCVFVGRSREW